ncbi:hypothetical protein ACIQVA_37475 [Streptomyces microflavus]|uniref:hypothetical protein n=1 Tax=Streptomyces microflavus TaxID=1919 RepID=UPI0037FE9776
MDTRFLRSWAHDLNHEEVRWKLALPKQPPPSADQKHPHGTPTTQPLEPQPRPVMGH